MSHFIEEIIDDIIKLDPELQNVKKDLEHLIQELIKDKPKAPFTQEFKESLKAQIVGAINEQKILYEEKRWNWQDMLNSIRFWMFSMSSVAVVAIFFVIFQNIEQTNIPPQDIIIQTSDQNISDNPQKESNTDTINNVSTKIQDTQENIVQISNQNVFENSQESPEIIAGGGASESADNVMMIAAPEAMSSKRLINETPENTTRTLCKTSEQFLSKYNLNGTSENTTKTFVYNNQTYRANIDFTNNKISINHISSQENIQSQTGIQNLNIFFKNNNFDIAGDYNSAIIEEKEKTIEYYYPRYEQQEGITAIIDKTNNIIFSIENICIYK